MALFQGSGTALVTPFTQDGIDFTGYASFIDWQIAQGTDALITCGTTGEPSTMTHQEKMDTIACAIETAKGRVPVFAGTGGNNTKQVIEDSIAAQDMGADGLLVVTPYYNKTSPSGLIKHFFAVADAVKIPIILYNVPSRTNMNITPEQLLALSAHKNIQGMKEASADITLITEMMRLCSGKLDFYSGSDDHVLPLLALGFEGVISVVSNIAPKQTHDMVAKYHAGDLAAARALQFALNPLTKALFSEVSPIPVKTALRLMGKPAGPLRMPLCDMQEVTLQNLTKAMQDFGLLPA